MTVLGALLGVEERAIKDNALWGRWRRGDDLDTPAHHGMRVTAESAIRLSAVWACVSLICDSIATLPLGSFSRQDGVRRPVEPQPAWISQPNPDQELQQWVSQQLLALLLDGGTAYVYMVRDRFGDVIEAWNVPPHHVTARIDRDRQRVVYDVHDPERLGTVTLTGADMFHIPGLSWPGNLCGVPPLEAARQMLGAGLGAQEFAERFYGQGFSAAGVVEVPGDLSLEQARELKRDFSRMNSGVRKSHLPAVLTGGAAWKPSTVTPEQAQFLETRQFAVSEIARFFRVPPHMIADVENSTSWGTGIEQQSIGFVTYTLRPWLTRLEQAYSRHLLPARPAGSFAKFNVNGLQRGDFKSRQDAYAVGRQWGWLSADDVRTLEDEPPLPDGQGGGEYIVPANFRPAGQEPPAPQPAVPPLADANQNKGAPDG